MEAVIEKPYEEWTDEEAAAEAERIAKKMGIHPDAVRNWIELRRAGHQGDDIVVDD